MKGLGPLVFAIIVTASCSWLLEPVGPNRLDPGPIAEGSPTAPEQGRPTTRADLLLSIFASVGRATGVMAPVVGVLETIGRSAISGALRT